MAGTSFLENQLLTSGDSDEKDNLVFSRGII
jgi:translation initiation factor 2 beta subunit (eIF-2beta)/eIF-5